ncbi:hypothetical protein [Streptomyces sp. YGL11-2]|uniref:hypothetical protein n=1 Tax=Streptomyces sp. YGL11-2 TaxID=3414028 RepID=UPI003CEAB221
MVERLLTEGRVRVADDDQFAEWRKVIDYAERHGLEPPGKRIQKVRLRASGWKLYLAEGSHPNSRSRKPAGDASVVPVPARPTSPHPIVAALRDMEERLVMPRPVIRRLLMITARVEFPTTDRDQPSRPDVSPPTVHELVELHVQPRLISSWS